MTIENEISKNWSLTDIHDVRFLKQSGERKVFQLDSNEGRYIAKIADPSKGPQKIINDTNILRFLEKINYPAPRLLQTRDGNNFIENDKGFIYVMPFIEGAEPEKTVANYAQLGTVTAQLHIIEGYQTSSDFKVAHEITKMLARAKKFDMDSRYAQLVNALPDFARLPQCLIHTDIGTHNSIQQPDGTIVLIDWDDAGLGTRILDLGFPLICDFMTNDLVFEEDRARAFYDSYAAAVHLNDNEKKHLFDAGMFYALDYTMFDDEGIIDGQWQKILAALEIKDTIISCLPS